MEGLEEKINAKKKAEGKEEKYAIENNTNQVQTSTSLNTSSSFSTFNYQQIYEKPLTFSDFIFNAEYMYKKHGVIVKFASLDPGVLGMTYIATNEVYLDHNLHAHEIEYVAAHEIRHHHKPYKDEYEIRKEDAYPYGGLPSYTLY